MSQDTGREKRALRRRILAVRDRLTERERAAKSRAITDRLARLPEYGAARAILFFVSFLVLLITVLIFFTIDVVVGRIGFPEDFSRFTVPIVM